MARSEAGVTMIRAREDRAISVDEKTSPTDAAVVSKPAEPTDRHQDGEEVSAEQTAQLGPTSKDFDKRSFNDASIFFSSLPP